MLEGRPHSVLPLPNIERIEEKEQFHRLRLKKLDTLAARLEAAERGGAARFQADHERRLAANLRALEREAPAEGQG